MKGWDWEDGQFRILNGDRIVSTTGGTLLQFLTAEQEFSTSLAFPDANKGQIYSISYETRYASGGNRFAGVTCRTAVGALPQEWSDTIILGSAPAGADLAVVRVVLARTNSPSHTWIGQTLVPIFPEDEEIQLWGSMNLEMGPGITRGLTIDIIDGDLVAIIDQTVGPVSGNFQSHGVWPPAEPNTVFETPFIGSENSAPDGQCLPVWWSDSSPYIKVESDSWSGPLGAGNPTAFVNARRYGGASAASYADPTDYSSTYDLTVKCRFGRRS
jgi:hypothetical protein